MVYSPWVELPVPFRRSALVQSSGTVFQRVSSHRSVFLVSGSSLAEVDVESVPLLLLPPNFDLRPVARRCGPLVFRSVSVRPIKGQVCVRASL
jgi:hypothetical protein